MKLGFITSILEDFTYEEMIDFASEHGFECVEVASWKKEKAERRYAGVSHIDAERFLAMTVMPHIFQDTRKKKNVEISALAYYPNVMDADRNKGEAAVEHLKNVILASAKLNVNMVTTFIGRDQTKTVEENLLLVKKSMGTGHPAGRRKRRKDSNRKLSDAVRTRSVAGRSESYDDSGSVEKSF